MAAAEAKQPLAPKIRQQLPQGVPLASGEQALPRTVYLAVFFKKHLVVVFVFFHSVLLQLQSPHHSNSFRSAVIVITGRQSVILTESSLSLCLRIFLRALVCLLYTSAGGGRDHARAVWAV